MKLSILRSVLLLVLCLSLILGLASCVTEEPPANGGSGNIGEVGDGDVKKGDTSYDGGIEFTSKGDGTCYVSGFVSSEIASEIKIPLVSPDGDDVSEIGRYAFEKCSSLQKVDIPLALDAIGEGAFSGCAALREITAHGVSSIGSKAFNGCTSLGAVTLGDVGTLGASAFASCDSLSSITLSNTESIGVSAFSGCEKLASVSIVGNVTTKIEGFAFADCDGLSSVKLGSASVIGDYAFHDCDALTRIEVPSSVEKIGGFAFADCDKLGTAVLNSVESIGANAFSDCIALVTLQLKGNVKTEIGKEAFAECPMLSRLTLDSAYTIGERAFYNCDAIPSVEMPNKLSYIGKSAFRGCDGMKSVTTPAACQEIGESAFMECTSLNSVTVNGGVIGKMAFFNCDRLNSLKVADAVGLIGESAFEDCDVLTELSVLGKDTVIGYSAFAYCDDLLSVTLSCKSVGGYAFGECDRISSLVLSHEDSKTKEIYNVSKIAERAFYGCESITSLVIPDGTEEIGDYAFARCTTLESVKLGKDAKSIGRFAFSSCYKLASFDVSEENKSYKHIDGHLFDIKGEVIVRYAPAKQVGGVSEESYEIPTGVKIIGDGAFEDCVFLVEIAVPGTVNEIGDYAFRDCVRMVGINIDNNIELIGEGAFYSCNSITDIAIPSSVRSIGKRAFYSCTKLGRVAVGSASSDAVTSIGEYAFHDCIALEVATVYNSLIGDYAFIGCDALDTVMADMSSIATHAFYRCASLNKVQISGGSIGNSAFEGCSQIETVTMRDITSIGDSAFRGCSSVKDITVPASVKEIGYRAFEGCSSLQRFAVPFTGAALDGNTNTHFGYIFGAYTFSDNAAFVPATLAEVVLNGSTAIPAYAFSGCKDIESVVVYAGTVSIGEYAFRDCVGLESAVFEDDSIAAEIGKGAFIGCSSLAAIVIPDSVTKVGESAFSGCSALGEATFGENSKLAYVGDEAFLSCSALESIYLPVGLLEIGTDAFSGCASLTSLYIDDLAAWCAVDVKSAASNPLFAVGGELYIENVKTAELKIPAEVTDVFAYTFVGCSGITSLRFESDSIGSVGKSAFLGCTALTSVALPVNTAKIGAGVFEGCESIKDMVVPFVGADVLGGSGYLGYFFGASSYEGNATAVPASLETVEISAAAASGYTVPKFAFSGCGVKTVKLSDSIVGIGDSAFAGCASLAEVNIGKDSAIVGIGVNAFRDCAALQSIYLPAPLATVGADAFSGCDSLGKVTVRDIAAWCSVKFENLSSNPLSLDNSLYLDGEEVKKLVIPATVQSVCDYAFAGCKAIEEVVFLGDIERIGAHAFDSCSGIAKLEIPASVVRVGESAFLGCSGLVKAEGGVLYADNWIVGFEDGVKDVVALDGTVGVADRAFTGCATLETVILPVSVEYIGFCAFDAESPITELVLPFVGAALGSSVDTHFAYIFGAPSADENAAFVPETLTSVKILGGETVASDAFRGCAGIVKISLNPGIKSIGESAFLGCSALVDVYFGNGSELLGIGEAAFSGCIALKSVKIPVSVASMGERAFYGCLSLETVWFGNNSVLEVIEKETFAGCTALKNVNFGEDGSLDKIEKEAFCGCTALERFKVPASVTQLGERVFADCTALAGVRFGDGSSLYSISRGAFEGCKSLKSVVVPSSTKIIGFGAFSGCESIEKLTLPFVGYSDDGISDTYFGFIFGATEYKYNYNVVPASLKTVKITSAKTIASYAFYNCANIKSISLPVKLESIGENVLLYCTSLESIEIPFVGARRDGKGATHFGYLFGAAAYADNAVYVSSKLKTVTLLDKSDRDMSDITIAQYAFFGCNRIESIRISDAVTEIGARAFEGCSALKSVAFSENGGIKNIGASAFRGCAALESVDFGSGRDLDTVKTYAFADCIALVNVDFGDSCTLDTVEGYAFSGCTALKSILIPASVSKLGVAVFEGCTSLVDVQFGADKTTNLKLTEIPDETFDGCVALPEITVPDEIELIGVRAFQGCKSLEKVVFGAKSKLRSIGDYAFRYCESLAEIDIPDSTERIGVSAFLGVKGGAVKTGDDGIGYVDNWAVDCDAASVKAIIKDGTVGIADSAFSGCSAITDVEIPKSLKFIGVGAFSKCTGVKRVVIPFLGSRADGKGATHFGYLFGAESYDQNRAFVPAVLTELTLTGGESIAENAFYGCDTLVSVTLPEELRSIGASAFMGCGGIKTVYVVDLDKWAAVEFGSEMADPTKVGTDVAVKLVEAAPEA